MLDRTKRNKLLAAVVACTLVLSGCGAVQKEPDQGGAPISTPDQQGSEQQQSKQLTIYAVGNESMELTERTETIKYQDTQQLVEESMAALQKDPGEASSSLWKPIPVHSVQLIDGIVTLDISLPDEARLGAPGEMQLLESLKLTLFQIEDVQGIEILLDGEKTESLMGHVELDYPMTRDGQ